MTRRAATGRRTASSRRIEPTAEAATWLAWADGIYRAGRDAEAVSACLDELARALGASASALRIGGDDDAWTVVSADADDAEPSWFELGGEPPLALGIVRETPLSSGERALLAALAPHVARACAVAPTPGMSIALLPAALDRLSLGVLLIGEDGRLVHANHAAQRALEAGDGIRRDGDGIRLESAEAEAALAEVRAALPKDRRSRPATRIVVAREGRPPLEVLAVSLEGLEVDEQSALALFVSDPEQGIGTPPSVLREIYGLSRREADVVEQILLGRSLDTAATALGIHLETVRMHLKQVFQKVGTRRQVDLVRLLLSGVSNLRWE
jgi:DNA-binding CsgD family transcriptional regulator